MVITRALLILLLTLAFGGCAALPPAGDLLPQPAEDSRSAGTPADYTALSQPEPVTVQPPDDVRPAALADAVPPEQEAGVQIPPGLSLPGTMWNFSLVGHSDLGRRGMNAGLALAGDCAYIGGRAAGQPVLTVDVADPAAPRVVGAFGAVPGSTARELRASEELKLLIVLHYRLSSVGGRNDLTLYDIRDCRRPLQVGSFDFGPLRPHEFFLWRDPQRPGRALAFVALFAAAPGLIVVDLSNPAAPHEIDRWNIGLPATETVGGRLLRNALHSLSVSPDGTRAYLALWDGGFQIVDTSEFAAGRPRPVVRPITLPGRRLRYAPLAPGHTHSAVAVPGRPLVLLTDEVYAPNCPYGWLRIVDIRDPTAPRQVGEYRLPENDPARCSETLQRRGTYSAHNPLALPHLALVSWHAGGLQAIDISDPAAPRRAGVFVPAPVPNVAEHDAAFGAVPVVTWSYPIIKDGLVYVVDVRNGLYILRYTGMWAEEVTSTAFAEGNSNA